MTLKSIELIGFKSFGKKSVINFTTPITSIVGPNGSGKSNIVEAIRFVLGEQSMKSLRGKGGSDLIFKGSKSLSSSGRAMVSITFDNKNKIFSFTNSGLGISLDYEEIIISREVFADGVNKYSINNTEVRLKDVIDLLASVNIGSSGYHIISQGETDRVLNASNKERRAMIEDALGLKIYQLRIRESERKLEKTSLNIKEIQSLRREIAPHLSFLKKQVQVLEKAKEMRQELKNLYSVYLPNERIYIEKETDRLAVLKSFLKEQELSLSGKIEELNKLKNKDQQEDTYEKEIKENEDRISNLRREKDELIHRQGKIEGIIEGLERQFQQVKKVEHKIIDEIQWKNFISEISGKLDEAIRGENLPEVIVILKNIKIKLAEFSDSSNQTQENIISLEENQEYKEMKKVNGEIIENINKIDEEEKNIRVIISQIREKDQQYKDSFLDSERLLYELLSQKNKVVSDLHSLSFEEEKILMIKNAFDMELAEASVLIGQEIIGLARIPAEAEVLRSSQEELRRKIERIKIKIEDAGVGSGDDVMKEYQETVERDNFLAKEIEDLNISVDDCHNLIEELKNKLDIEFKVGIEKINKQFNEFFAIMFGGGGASLSITMESKKTKRDNSEAIESEEELLSMAEEEEIAFERGIEISVNLPKKKVKDLHMLSGGERSLTSIALLFAISQVNPPPFLVLDETDAALDEANSRKYGDMLVNLSKYSELIVVTHNRETMSRAQVLYGITMGAEGVSRLLSIHLEEATSYAK
jgi:chromosome segregation ATPase